MKKRKKNQNGITLIALVISIIVMLILAGVSLNATVGENGILTKATSAKLAQEEAQRREELEYLLFDFNSSKFLGAENGFTDYLNQLKADGKIDDYLYTDTLIVKYKDNYYETEQQGDYYAIKRRLESDLSGGGSGGASGNNFIVTPDNLTSGNLEIAQGSSYVVLDKVSGKDFNFAIPAGDPVTIKLMGDMFIDNSSTSGESLGRSAIDLAVGATLNLYVYGNVEVNSSVGENATGRTPGVGGFAGIHVPEGSTLNLFGNGTITAIGGDAGDGASYVANSSNIPGGSGGGGAGAGIGGRGGKGGSGIGNSKEDGFAGENCGNVNINDELTVYAYGGAGGTGGSATNSSGSGGGGGYPAAGIGGGGAGGGCGTGCCAGGGGYTGGSAGRRTSGQHSDNGLAGLPVEKGKSFYNAYWNGGGYFEGPSQIYDSTELKDINDTVIDNIKMVTCLGGIGNQGYGDVTRHVTSNGGAGGKGGNIKVSSNSKVLAYNGNRYTDGTSYENGKNQCPIYLQRGIKNTIYAYTYGATTSNGTYWIPTIKMKVVSYGTTGNTLSGYVNKELAEKSEAERSVTLTIGGVNTTIDMSNQGVGSGAGYIEVSNGNYEEI